MQRRSTRAKKGVDPQTDMLAADHAPKQPLNTIASSSNTGRTQRASTSRSRLGTQVAASAISNSPDRARKSKAVNSEDVSASMTDRANALVATKKRRDAPTSQATSNKKRKQVIKTGVKLQAMPRGMETNLLNEDADSSDECVMVSASRRKCRSSTDLSQA